MNSPALPLRFFPLRPGVTLEMIGTAGSSGPQRLTAQHDTFERGQCDEFLLRVLDVGALKQIIIKSDGKGLGASWCAGML